MIVEGREQLLSANHFHHNNIPSVSIVGCHDAEPPNLLSVNSQLDGPSFGIIRHYAKSQQQAQHQDQKFKFV